MRTETIPWVKKQSHSRLFVYSHCSALLPQLLLRQHCFVHKVCRLFLCGTLLNSTNSLTSQTRFDFVFLRRQDMAGGVEDELSLQ